MDARHFDALSRALAASNSRRRLLTLLAPLPTLGGLAALVAPEDAAGKGRRKRRKKRHKHGKGRRRQQHGKKGCKPQPTAQTCAGHCGTVQNNCRKLVDCGPCSCDPACGACERCAGTTCEACDPCCNGACCQQGAICHAVSGECCTPDSRAATCDGKCGQVVNNCGATVACGSCACDPPCSACQTCDEDTGACVADPDQQGDACGPAQSCDQGTVTPQGSCNAAGVCTPADPVSCAPYAVCDGATCATSCASSSDCVAGRICDDRSQCVAPLPNGQDCRQNAQCSSGHCVDGVCCNTACDSACQACNLTGSKGTCSTEANGSACGSGDVCCSGACVDCCTNAQCGNPAPICVSNTCTACSVSNPCPGSQLCCDGSCFSGICCAGAECAPAGNACTGHRCACGTRAVCAFPTPTCCGDPGECVYTRSNNANCGACGAACGAGQTCYQGSCCTPTTCSALGKTCGTWPDGCGGWLECGGCPAGQVCDEGACQACDVCAGSCPYRSVTSALSRAATGGVVRICPGTYTEIGGSSVAYTTKSVTLVGAGIGPGGTFLDAGGAGGAETDATVYASGTPGTPITVVLRDMVITGANNAARGGGMSLYYVNLTVTRVLVKDNIANWGGGIDITGGSLTLNDTVIAGNTIGVGYGGGISSFSTTITMNAGSTITDNTSGYLGGGIFTQGSTVTLNAGSSITGNDATSGGGIYINSGAVTLRSGSSITENRALADGGGIANLDTVTRDAGSVIDNNSPSNCVNTSSGTGC